MTASVGLLSVLVTVATVFAALAPLVLAVMWVRDWKKGQLW